MKSFRTIKRIYQMMFQRNPQYIRLSIGLALLEIESVYLYFLYSLSDRHNCLQQKLDSVESFMLDVFTQLLFVSDSRQ